MLTFGRRAAGELRDRVTARLGGTVREPIARTFHSYAFGVLRMAAVAVGLPSPRLLAGPEQDVVLRELIEWRPRFRPVALAGASCTPRWARGRSPASCATCCCARSSVAWTVRL